MQDAIDLYESIMQHHLGCQEGPTDGAGGGGVGGGGLLSVPPAALANLCVCYVISSQNEVAEDLLRRVEEETSAAQVGKGRILHLVVRSLWDCPLVSECNTRISPVQGQGQHAHGCHS